MQIFFTILIVILALIFIIIKIRHNIVNKKFTSCSGCQDGSCSSCPLKK